MKKFFEDYKDLCKHCGRFYKDHWVATLLLTTAGIVLSGTPFVISAIKEKKEYNEYLKEVEKINSMKEES